METELSDILFSLENFARVLLQCTCMCAQSLSHVRLFATRWTLAHPDSSVHRISQAEYWSRLPFPPPPGDLPDTELEPGSPALAGRFLTTEPAGKPAPARIPCSHSGDLYMLRTSAPSPDCLLPDSHS